MGTRVPLGLFTLAAAGRERGSGRGFPGPSSGLTGPRTLLFPPAVPSGWSLKPDFRSSADVQGRCREVEQMGPGIPVRAEGGGQRLEDVLGYVLQGVPGMRDLGREQARQMVLGAFPVPATKICPELPLTVAGQCKLSMPGYRSEGDKSCPWEAVFLPMQSFGLDPRNSPPTLSLEWPSS